MILHTLFDLGQTVWLIRQETTPVTRPCEVCDGRGYLDLVKGGNVHCTNQWASKDRCNGGVVTLAITQPWKVVIRSLTVGQVEACAPQRTHDGWDESVRYMCEETGVGSGSVYYEPHLFASREEAQAECDARNAVADPAPGGTEND